MIYDVAVIGGGPAGMMAAIQAARKGRNVILLEKNATLGNKLLLTGKGRCNVTTSNSMDEIIQAFGEKGKFLYGPLSRHSNTDTMTFFEEIGVPLKEEQGSRIFPVSNSAETIRDALESELHRSGVTILTNATVKAVQPPPSTGGNFTVIVSKQEPVHSHTVIIATGGRSYPITGATGNGYRFAQELGHTVIPPKPSLVPLYVDNAEIRSLAGLGLKHVRISFFRSDRPVPFSSHFGEMLFTHKGISGPIVLEASKQIGEQFAEIQEKKFDTKLIASIDLKPALTEKQISQRIHRESVENPRSEYKTLLAGLLPRSLIDVAINRTGIDPHLKISALTGEQKSTLTSFLKNFDFEITGIAPIEQGIVTAGGVDLKEVSPKTMESKIVPGLYFAGEVLDLDGPTGGYNLQVAWTTGYVAGIYSARKMI
jgi:predicted Rossmann fold flavoprotein